MLKEYTDIMLAKMQKGCKFKMIIKGYGSASRVDTTFTNTAIRLKQADA